MQNSFLYTSVHSIIERYGAQLGNLCIVVPNRRAGLYIRNIIADAINGPVWSPDIYAQDDFMAHLSGFTVADRLTQLFHFYEVYRQIEGEDARTFSDFIHWAPTLLADFNEIDQYLADPEQLFTYLNEAKAIDMWNLGRSELTDFQKRYLEFWNKLESFYEGLNTELSANGLAYQGMAYRKATENVESGAIDKWEKIFFLGFNALTKAEEVVMKHLTKTNRAEILWDVDAFYFDNHEHEAGKFLRKYKGFFSTEIVAEDLLADPAKTIEIIGVSGNSSQTKLAGQLLEEIAAKNNGDTYGTALVLADESLLLPALNSLPTNVNDVNVTMGYPLKYTPVASFVDAMFTLHINSQKFSNGRSEQRFYYKDVVTILNHPVFGLLNNDTVIPAEIIQAISENNYVFLTPVLFAGLVGEAIQTKLAFKNSTPIEFVNNLEALIEAMRDNLLSKEEKPGNDLTLEYLYTYYRYLQKLQTLLADKPLVSDLHTLRSLFNQLIAGSTLPFYGEPLKGLQVMGMLETRTLDFENVVLLSANEGVLPQGKAGHSFIPMEVKRYFELPTYNDRDAIFSYHFYRLLQRAKNVWILYGTQTDGGIGSKERSRFITQLVNELKGPTITERMLDVPLGHAGENVIAIEKTPEIIDKLNAQAEKGFSPTALSMFIRCPLQFYFRHIAKLYETEEVEETLEASTMGSLIHKILETLFTPYVQQELMAEDIEHIRAKADAVTDEVFEEEFGSDNYRYGKNLLIYRVSKRFIENYLQFQKETLVADMAKGFHTVINGLEIELRSPITVGNVEAHIGGKADRIEESGGGVRVIDYKTGAVYAAELKFGDWTDLLEDAGTAKSLQLLTYAWLYKKANPDVGKIKPSILAFTAISEGYKECSTPTGQDYITGEDLTQIENVLKAVVGRIFNTEETFYQTSEKANCRYCPYNNICNRN